MADEAKCLSRILDLICRVPKAKRPWLVTSLRHWIDAEYPAEIRVPGSAERMRRLRQRRNGQEGVTKMSLGDVTCDAQAASQDRHSNKVVAVVVSGSSPVVPVVSEEKPHVVTGEEKEAKTEPKSREKKPKLGSNLSEKPPWPSPEMLVDLYNELTAESHPKVVRLSPGRRQKAQRYLRDFPERAFWVRVFTEVRHSAFLRGQKPSPGHEHFCASFDWLLTKGKDGSENAVKVAEGQYRDD